MVGIRCKFLHASGFQNQIWRSRPPVTISLKCRQETIVSYILIFNDLLTFNVDTYHPNGPIIIVLSFFLGSYCNDCRDLDLSRDSALLAQEWCCAVPQCGQPYDREVMENALLQIVRQRERIYHLQDLTCLRCNQVKAAHLSEQCTCAGSFRCREDASEFRGKMQIFLKIAAHQNFQLLSECTSWILEVK